MYQTGSGSFISTGSNDEWGEGIMKITELLGQDTIILALESDAKEAVISELAQRLDEAGKLTDVDLFQQEIWKREQQGSTGIGEGVAIPHAKTNAVKVPAIVFGRSKQGIDYEALDQQPSHLFFMIAATEGANNEHLDTLARLSSMLMDPDFRKKLLEAKDEAAILALLDTAEKEKIQ